MAYVQYIYIKYEYDDRQPPRDCKERRTLAPASSLSFHNKWNKSTSGMYFKAARL